MQPVISQLAPSRALTGPVDERDAAEDRDLQTWL